MNEHKAQHHKAHELPSYAHKTHDPTHSALERKIAQVSVRLARPDAPYQDPEIAAGWARHHRLFKFNPNHDERGRFDFGSGGRDSQSAPTTSPNWPVSGQSGLKVPQAIGQIQDQAPNNSGSQAQCALYVREALKAGGVDLKDHPVSADQYGSYLERSGFVQLTPNPAAGYDAKPGDIAVFGRLTATGSGHIQIFDGKNWISDFRQNGFWPSHAYREGDKGYKIYRP